MSRLGPTIIIAAVVCGPGSIVTSSRVGAEFGYQLVWIVVVAAVLMVGMVRLAGRIGLAYERTPCDELAARLGRPAAAVVGIIVFLLIVGFQSSNNIAVVAGLRPLIPETVDATTINRLSVLALILVNALSLGALYWFRGLYRKVERFMKLLVLLMVLSFLANAIAAAPSLSETLRGLIPRLPSGLSGGAALNLLGLVATTFSIAAAFYQAYLVRERGWRITEAAEAGRDATVGIGMLGGITLIIMLTSASVLHGKVDPGELKGAADVAVQLEPLFGTWAKVLFCAGIFAGAFSSFLVNAMIGGTLLADGFGKGGRIESKGPKHLTAAALLAGLAIALPFAWEGGSPLNFITFAQAVTVIGGPVLALALLYLGTRPELTGDRRIPRPILVLAFIGFAVTCLLAVNTALGVYAKLKS